MGGNIKQKVLALLMILSLVIGLLAGCTNSSDNSQSAAPAGKDKTDSTKISGEVNLAVYDWAVQDYTKIVEEFNKIYPNIHVKITPFQAGSLNEYLTTQAAANSLPDIAFGWDNLNYPISQGWIHPLDEFLEKDDEIKNVDPGLLESYKFGGKTYALPMNLQFSAIMINLDLLEQLNLDPPSYNWTIDDFKTYAKKATTDKYSGINHLWRFYDPMSGVLSSSLHEMAYDPQSHTFKFTEGSFVKAMSLYKELKSVPGLVSDDLKNQKLRDAGKADDYQKKFGKDADALREGKVLMGFHGTWDLSWIRTMNYKFDMYPLPQDPTVGYREAMHADHAFMLSTAKDPQAAFELLKWLTYGKDGVLARLNYFMNKQDGNGNPAPDFFIPVTRDPEIANFFNGLDIVPEGVKYMYAHMDKAFRADYYKIVPDWNKIMDEIIGPKCDDAAANKVDPAAIAPELEQKANEALKQAWDNFDKQLKDVQSK